MDIQAGIESYFKGKTPQSNFNVNTSDYTGIDH